MEERLDGCKAYFILFMYFRCLYPSNYKHASFRTSELWPTRAYSGRDDIGTESDRFCQSHTHNVMIKIIYHGDGEDVNSTFKHFKNCKSSIRD